VTIATWLVIAACAVAMVAAGYTRNRVPVAVSVTVAAALRVTFALMTSTRFTPWDVRIYFKATAEAVLHGRDPLMTLPGRQWNFLELMPYVHALEFKTGLPWVIAVKIAPIAADLVLVWIVARLAGADGRTRALQYAVNPLSLLIVSLHGQIEPVALALALGGLLLLRRERPVLAGLLLGAAVAAKTWPIVILVAVLPLRDPRRAARIVAGSVVVPVACLVSGVIFLDTAVPHAISRLVTYSGYVYNWTWSGTWVLLGNKGTGYNSSLSGLGSLLIVAGVAAVLWLLRRHPAEVRALGALAAVLACTAGFGTQYLFWVLPLAIALSSRWRNHYVIAASAWAALAYLTPFGSIASRDYLIGLSWLPAAFLVAIITEQARSQPTEVAARPGLPAPDSLLAGPARRPELVPVPAAVPAAVSATGRSDKDVPAAG
jgi:Glycosyltransferase family 87